MVMWPQRAHKNHRPSALPIITLKPLASTQYGHRTTLTISEHDLTETINRVQYRKHPRAALASMVAVSGVRTEQNCTAYSSRQM
jgi:hypothetical protein